MYINNTFSKLGKFEIELGKFSKRFDDISRYFKFTKLPISFGNTLIRLADKFRLFKIYKFPISGGISVNKHPDICIFFKPKHSHKFSKTSLIISVLLEGKVYLYFREIRYISIIINKRRTTYFKFI